MKTFSNFLQKTFFVLFLLFTSGAYAQNYPNGPVKIVVPFPPGGTTDILARVLANELTKKWGQSVVVENKPGASGTIFSEQLTNMPPDGYTLMVTATHHVINPSLYKNLKHPHRLYPY
jgi:tripartite-type tricarboxylate transporter receptor subunit TctC